MEKRKCKICGEETSDIDHLDGHYHNRVIEYLYNSQEDHYCCKMCPIRKDENSKIKTHLFMDHDKTERFIQVSEDISGLFNL